MNTVKLFLFFATASLASSLPVAASENHHHDEHEEHEHGYEDIHENGHEEHEHGYDNIHENGHEDENTIRISDVIAEKVGITTAFAAPRTIHENIIAYGKLTSGPEQLSHIRARYSGLIKSVKVNIGDKVTAGDLLAEVESNESLRNYNITAPISGTIVQRHANTGEVTQDQILFSVANFDSLWVELRIYPSQHNLVKAGQAVHFHANNQSIHGQINHIVPSLDKPWQLARLKIDNKTLGLLPGLLIEGNIAISETQASLAVTQQAVQIIDGKQGVFVKTHGEYDFQPLMLGQSDHDYVEVLSGIEIGTEYVTGNSYLLKAHFEKSEAEHHH